VALERNPACHEFYSSQAGMSAGEPIKEVFSGRTIQTAVARATEQNRRQKIGSKALIVAERVIDGLAGYALFAPVTRVMRSTR
jgi:hypothetical protein